MEVCLVPYKTAMENDTKMETEKERKEAKIMPDADGKTSIRGIDPELFAEARAAAIKKKLTIGEWLNEAMAAKLAKDQLVRKRKGE